MSQDKFIPISKDEHLLLTGLIPILIKDSKNNMKKSNKKALEVTINVLNNLQDKLKKIKF